MQKLLEDDDFYRIRIPSSVLNPPGKDYVISSVKAVSSLSLLDSFFVQSVLVLCDMPYELY